MGALSTCVLLLAISSPPGARKLSLEEALELAMRTHPQLQTQDAELELAEVSVGRAWSELYPRVSGTAGLELTPGDVVSGESIIQRRIQQRATGNLRWILADASRILAIDTAGQRRRARGRCRDEARLSLRVAVKLAYFEALYADRQVEVRSRALELAQVHRDKVGVRRELGEATEVEVLKAEVEIADAEQQLIGVRNQVELSRIGLAILVGLVGADGVVPPLVLERPRSASTSETGGAVARALEHRPDLERRRIELDAARQAELGAWLAWLPRLVGTGQVTWSDVPGFLGTNVQWQLGVGLEMELFDAGLRLRETEAQAQAVRIAAARLEQDRRQVVEQVLRARATLRAKEAELKTARHRSALAERTASMVAAKYEGGFSSQLEWLDAQERLFSARVSEVLTELEVDRARIEVEAVEQRSPKSDGCSIP